MKMSLFSRFGRQLNIQVVFCRLAMGANNTRTSTAINQRPRLFLGSLSKYRKQLANKNQKSAVWGMLQPFVSLDGTNKTNSKCGALATQPRPKNIASKTNIFTQLRFCIPTAQRAYKYLQGLVGAGLRHVGAWSQLGMLSRIVAMLGHVGPCGYEPALPRSKKVKKNDAQNAL